MAEHDQPPEWAVSILSGIAAVQRELRLLHDELARHCGEERAAHQAQMEGRARSTDEIARLLGALADSTGCYMDARGVPRGPGTVHPIRPDGDR